MSSQKIVIKGAREHNLKNVNLTIPRDKMIVFTGLSGSGKSSLAFDTLYAEGQRRYVESLSSYARQFLGQMEKPDVDSIEGLSPAISIDQKTTSRNPRSTVGTVTEIYDYFRLLFARIGIPYCPTCGKEIKKQTIDQIVDQILQMDEGKKIQLLAPVVRGKKGQHQKILDQARKSGYVRVLVDGNLYELSEDITLDKNKKHDIDVVVDRLVVKETIGKRLTDSIETVMHITGGSLRIDVIGEAAINFNQNFACPDGHISFDEIEPRMFSFNNPFGACPECHGLGFTMEFDKDLVIPDGSLSIDEGAIKAPGWSAASNEDSHVNSIFKALSLQYGFSLKIPFDDLDKNIQDIILYGTGNEKVHVIYAHNHGEGSYDTAFEGILNSLERRYKETTSEYMRQEYQSLMTNNECPSCHGARLRPTSLAVKLGNYNISEVTEMSINDVKEFMQNLPLTERQHMIGDQILKEIDARIKFLMDVGLDYLSLSRSAGTLSGGEAQRIRLATQIGSGLVGVVYILDEPSIGLHQRDNVRLLATLKHLRDLGNTLIVVEHDEDTMFEADCVVDIGPKAGVHGGEIVAIGTAEEIMAHKESITGAYLSGRRKIAVPKERRPVGGNWLTVKGASENNLKNIDISIPLGILTAVTGVSGSGKSSFINEILYKRLARDLNRAKMKPGRHDDIEGLEYLDKVIDIDQSPIGRTPRSNPATYTGLFDPIRDIFAKTVDAKMKGYQKGRFSFNVKGGRCEACRGDGINKIEMHFLPDIYVPCEVCHGKRYNRETLEIKYKGKNISEVLEMTVEDAIQFFEHIPKVRRKLDCLNDVGLSYIKLGQPSTTLSGGEAQRVKLATELSKRSTGKTVYILDEPTTGLHFADVHKLIKILQSLVESGNTVIVIEHNLDVIKTTDYVIDLGPEGGDRGGSIVAVGTPEEVAEVETSYTGQFLKKVFEKHRLRENDK
ncbi:excinuclease ABC (subunit A) [Petrocella atlantisensis]|uniref:UvrABC system protein A n=1 Tax=Petrocella atlantisensis TaxID=2173034 RepID=A0A3P7PDD2_9FIRM|nr:excinuclease ABC subunit UvrA [Petrocella atlantisensis]VDN46898.1 excinuclease ABC (subunit A) [Petrocella atlantisensis]